MIRVAYLITRLNIGGPSLHVFLLYKSLEEKGYDIDLYCGELEPGEEEMTYHETARGIKPIRLKGLSRDINPFSDLLLIARLYVCFRRTKPHIVHTHQAKAGAAGRIAAWLAGVPVVIHTFHGNIFRGHFGNLKVKIFIWLERMLSCITTKVIALSREQKRDLSEVFRVIGAKKIEIIPLGFDFDRFQNIEEYRGRFKRQLAIDKNSLLVGIIGRIEPVKNHRLLLEVAKIVRQKRKDVHFVIVGDGQLRPKIERSIEALNLDSIVTITGYLREIWEVLADLDIVALTSHSEGTPVSLIEAMAAGRPVISTRVGGVPDLIDDGVTGVLVEPNDPQTFAERLIALLDDHVLRDRMASAARERVRHHYATDRMIKEIDELYKTCMSDKRVVL